MSAVLQNAQFAQGLFQPGVAAFARYNQGRLALAQQNLAHMRELEADARATAMRRELANLQATIQREQIEATEAGANRRAKASEAATDARFRAAEAETDRRTREADAKITAAEKRANREATQRAYTRYTTAGGTKPLKDFGDLDSPDTAFEIERAIPDLERERAASTFGGIARVVDDSRSALASMLALNAEEESIARASALDAMTMNTAHKGAMERYNDLLEDGASSEVAEEAVRREYPAFGRALEALIGQQRVAIQAEKAKSPEFDAAQKQFTSLLAGAREFALKNNLPGDSLSALAPKAPTKPKALAGGGIEGMRKELGGAQGNDDGQSGPTPVSNPGIGGALGLLSRGLKWASRPGSFEDTALNFNLALMRGAEPVFGSIEYLAGGQGGRNDGYARREQVRRAIQAELQQRGGLIPLLRR